jgi:hypothetical protein
LCIYLQNSYEFQGRYCAIFENNAILTLHVNA